MASRTALAKKAESRGRQLATIRTRQRVRRAKTKATLGRVGGAYVGGALFGDNAQLGALAGLAGVGMSLAGYDSTVVHMLEGAGLGAIYQHAATNPPEFLQGIATSIQEKAAEFTEDDL